MRPSKGSLFIGLLWSCLYLPNTVAQQKTSPSPKPPVTLKLLKQSISDHDRLEWLTLSFKKKKIQPINPYKVYEKLWREGQP